MSWVRTVVLFALVTTVVVVSSVAAPVTALAGAAIGPADSMEPVDSVESVETPGETETVTPAETTPTPDDGPDGHADDPFPRWLPVAFAGVLVVGIAAVGGGLWVVYARVRRFLGR